MSANLSAIIHPSSHTSSPFPPSPPPPSPPHTTIHLPRPQAFLSPPLHSHLIVFFRPSVSSVLFRLAADISTSQHSSPSPSPSPPPPPSPSPPLTLLKTLSISLNSISQRLSMRLSQRLSDSLPKSRDVNSDDKGAAVTAARSCFVIDFRLLVDEDWRSGGVGCGHLEFFGGV